LVVVDVDVEDGAAMRVTLRNVPSFCYATDRTVAVPGLGDVRYDMAFGGNFYALVEAASVGLDVDPARAQQLIDAGAKVREAVPEPVHPVDDAIRGCHHVVFHAPGRDGAHARNATSIHPGWLDRSPCGTGTSARLANLHARGRLAVGESFGHESIIGTRFTGRIAGLTEIGGVPAVVPEITGRAWMSGQATLTLDPSDPFPGGFLL